MTVASMLERETNNPLPHEARSNTRGGRHRYSFLRALGSLVSADGGFDAPLGYKPSGLEGEVSAEVAKRTGRSPRGFYVPLDILGESRALDSTSGAGAIQTITDSAMVAAFRPRMVLGELGATILNIPAGRSGKAVIPRVATGSAVSWLTEGASPGSGTNPTTDQILFAPHDLSAYVDCSRLMAALLGRPDLERRLLSDLTASVAAEIDRAAFVGAGEDGQPLGLLNTPGLPETALGDDGGAPTRSTLIAMERAASAVDQAPEASPGWVTTVDGRAKLRSIDGTEAAGAWLWKDGRVLDSPAFATGGLPSDLTKGEGEDLSVLLFGLWRNLAVNLFGEALDVLVDPYTLATSGLIRITAFQGVDVKVIEPTAFNAVRDFATA